MPDGTDLFEEAFGSAHEDEADDIEEPTQAKRKTSGAEKTDAQKASARTETASADDSAQSDLVPLKERSKKTRKPRVKKESPKKEAPVIESREHREAIKKMVLQKATQAARGDADEAEEDDAADEEDADTDDTDGGSGSDTNEDDSRAKGTPKRKTGKDDAADAEESETDDSDGDFLEHMDSDDWLREEGTQEEGISAKKTGASDDGGAPKTTRPLTPTASDVALKFLEDDAKHIAFIGRKKSVFKQYGDTAALFVGRVEEPSDPQSEKHIYLDSLNPHVVFVCGARGSGKSYVLGVIAEELALKNKDVGAIVVDPIGVFWSMRFPNKEEKEVQSLGSWGIMPQGLDNLKVFIPRGIAASVPKSTFDGTFAIQPSLLTVEDWCLTFNIERFSPTGLLMEKALTKVRDGFTDTDEKKIKPKGSAYGLDDMVYCLEKDNELNSRDRGYKQDSIRALVSRFEAAKNWGIFDQKGTPLGELSRQNQLTILDTSFLEDNVTALVIGVLARRILAARKLSARKEAAKRLKTVSMDELLELDIPPTWLFIDEAHTLIPSGNVSTPATSALVEYVKQGRRPGCSLVFATQQPSAIDSRVLSQLDVLIAHKLVFDDDIKAANNGARHPGATPYEEPGALASDLVILRRFTGGRISGVARHRTRSAPTEREPGADFGGDRITRKAGRAITKIISEEGYWFMVFSFWFMK
jgi:DNA helicase HerA-like ATPase